MHDDGDSLTLYDSAATCDDSEEPFGRAAISDEPSGSSRLDGMAGEIRSEVGSERSTDGEERCTDGSEDVEIIGEDGSDSNEIIVELVSWCFVVFRFDLGSILVRLVLISMRSPPHC